jgi:AcrR family transcriptional regulator
MAKVRTPRQSWIEAAMAAIATGGPDAVRVEALARRLGVSKGGFYWHFDDRGELVEAALNSWEKSGTDDVIASVEGGSGDARDRLRRLFELAPSAKRLFAMELALRDWARRDRAVASRLRRVDARRLSYLRSLFDQITTDEEDAEARTLLAYSLFVGSYFVVPGDSKKARRRSLQLAIDRLLA